MLLDERLARVDAAAGEDERSALGREQPRDGLPEAARRTRDDNDLSL